MGSLQEAGSFEVDSIDGLVDRPILNLNERKVDQLSTDTLQQIDAVLSRHVDALQYWGYALRQ